MSLRYIAAKLSKFTLQAPPKERALLHFLIGFANIALPLAMEVLTFVSVYQAEQASKVVNMAARYAHRITTANRAYMRVVFHNLNHF